MREIVIGIDGNCGFALRGANLQEGQSEFVEVPAPGGKDEQIWAANNACLKLIKRLGLDDDYPYTYGPGHPCQQEIGS